MIPLRIIAARRLPIIRSSFTHQECRRNVSSSEEDIVIVDSSEKLPTYSDDEIERICNKSRLRADHALIYAGQHPLIPDEEKPQYMRTLKWQRKLIGLCGFEGQHDAGICFTTKAEMEDLIEYEKVAFNVPLLEIRKKELEKLARMKEERYEREKQITKGLAKQEEWVKQLRARMDERNEVAEQAKAERARLLEEVRRYFGYTIDPKDEKFQIMLAMKERELNKEKKQEKKKQKEQEFLEKLAALETGGDKKKTKTKG